MAKVKSKADLPSRPTLTFRGKPQPAEFSAGAFALRDMLTAIVDTELPDGTVYDEIRIAGQFADRLLELLKRDDQASQGAIAALAHWLVASAHGELDPTEWVPLAAEPVYMVRDGHDWYLPPQDSQFFSVDGEPVSVGPELVAYAWSGSSYRDFRYRRISIDVVRLLGKPITATEFEKRRMQLAAPDTRP